MYGEDIKALRNFQSPSIFLEVVNGDHLELRKIGYFGRILRRLGIAYRNTTLDKVTRYISDNIPDLSITKDAHHPLKRIVKRIKKADRRDPTRFPEDVKRIENYMQFITPNATKQSIVDMTNAEVMDNFENFTIKEFNELPYIRVWEIFIKPILSANPVLSPFQYMLAPPDEDVVEEPAAIDISVELELQNPISEPVSQDNSISNPLASSVINQ